MAKCKHCPHKRTCRDACYGDIPCDFALAFDKLAAKVERRDKTIKRQKEQLATLTAQKM